MYVSQELLTGKQILETSCVGDTQKVLSSKILE